MGARRVFFIVILVLLLAAVADSASLMRRAERLPYGGRRDLWTTVWRPFTRAGDVLYLSRPRGWLDAAAGRRPPRSDAFLTSSGPAPAMVLKPDEPLIMPEPGWLIEPEPPPLPPFRHISPDTPLRVWIGGDSLAVFFAQSLLQQAGDTGLITGDQNTRISTGLSRPDYFDWPGELQRVAAEESPDVIVLLLGTNDGQGIRTPAGDTYQPQTDGWRAEYRRRVDLALDTVSAPGRLVVWVGLPPMRSSTLNSRVADINAIVREEIETRKNAVYIDSWQMFAGDGGGYAAYSHQDDGAIRLVREQDGVHFTRTGADVLASAVLRVIDDTFGLASARAAGNR